MVIAGTITVLDGISGSTVMLIGLLAIPPVIAAMSAEMAETGIVGAFCVVMALLSALWGGGVSEDYAVGVLTVIAGAVAGLWVASLREDLFREQQGSEILAEAGRLMEDDLDRSSRAQHLAELAVPALGDVAMVDMVDPDGSIHRVAALSGDRVAERFIQLRANAPIAPDGPHPVAEVIRTGHSIELNQLSDEEIDKITSREEERELLRKHRFHHCLVLPLHGRDTVLGAMTLWIMRPSNTFDETARRTADRLVQRSALALDNARLHEQQAHIAGVLQHSLLPRSLPQIPGFEIASEFLAAGEAYEVGGDFYDAFRSGSRSWGVVIGDVCGKGPEAAALTSLARYTVRTATGPETAPSAVLGVLHDSIRADRSDLRFCTAALLRVDTPDNGRGPAQVTVALGGHPPPLALRNDGGVEAVGEPGTLLGAIPRPDVADVPARLAPGESLVLYTDGMLATSDLKAADDPRWLANRLAKTVGRPATEIASSLASAAIQRQGGAPRDDIAVVVLRRIGEG